MVKAHWVTVFRASCLFACFAYARAEEIRASLPALEALVREWVALRSQIASENRDWRDRETQWQEEFRVLETEKAALEKETAEARESAASAERAMAEMRARRDSFNSTFRRLQTELDRAETRLREWRPLIPPSLRPSLGKGFDELPSTPAAAEQTPVSRRAQIVVSLYTGIESLLHGIHPVKEVLPAEAGRPREMDVLYVGLARGFAVTSDNRWAAVGTPRADGWTWQAAPDLAADIRRAIRVRVREQPAALVRLPLAIPPAPILSAAEDPEGDVNDEP